MRNLLLAALLASAFAVGADDLQRAQELAWGKRFAEAEALYRQMLERQPQSRQARLGLARVLLWQGRYGEAIAAFERLDGVEAVEGRATALYWSGDLRGAARGFRRVLELDSNREFARTSLREIASTAVPSQRFSVDRSHDDQPLDAIRAEVAATFYSDPQTRWTVLAGRYELEAERFARSAGGEYVTLSNETTVRGLTAGASLGVFRFPDGVRRPVGSVSVRRRALTVRVEQRPELASATSLTTHAASTITTLRWDHDRNWIGAVDASHRRYSDGNAGHALVAYAVAPLRRGAWTFWCGGSVAARDTEESRFAMTSISATREETYFRYRYRGEYDPYWTPDDLLEARATLAIERRHARGNVKLHADGGVTRDRGRAFGPDLGPTPFPPSTYALTFDRLYRPWRAGITADVALVRDLRFEAGVARDVTVDYRSTAFHASLVRRR